MAKRRIIQEAIQSIDQPWGGTDSKGQWAYGFEYIEQFLKNTLKGKGGEFYYDADTAKYLIFADQSSRDLYISDREQYADLLIGSFDAPASYTAEINMLTPASNVIFSGATGNYIDFTFDVKNRTGSSTGEAVVATFTFSNAGNIQKSTQVYAAGTNVHFLIDQYLKEGTNSVSVVITSRNTQVRTMASVGYTVVALKFTSSFDFSKPVEKGSYLSIPYYLEGAGVKYVEWYIDGVLQTEIDNVTDLKVSRTKSIPTSGISEGKHSLQARAYITNNQTNYYSNTLYFDFVVAPVGSWDTGKTFVLLGAVTNSISKDSIVLSGVQYQEISYDIAVFDSRSRVLVISILDNGELAQSVTMQPQTKTSRKYAPTTTGTHTIMFSADGASASLVVDAESSDVDIDEDTDSLVLKLSAKGRSNDETNPGTWVSGDYSTTFNNFAWNGQSGWNNGVLVIPAGASIDINIAPLGGNPVTNGRTIEIDYETSNIESDDAPVISLLNDSTNAGLDITASSAELRSSGGASVITKYKDGDRVHLAFIINKTSGDDARLIYIVNNGILERAASYVATDSFSVADNLHIGSDGCTVKVHSIRVYDKALTVDAAFGNYAIDSDSILEIAESNDILNDITGLIDADKVNAKLPIMIITGDMQPIFDATDKKVTVYVDIEYRNLQDATKNFTATGVRMRPQGTSSLGYPRKNLRPYTSAEYGCVMRDAEGNVIEDGLYAFKDGAQPVNCWTLKADYAESSGSHNTGVARMWNDLMYNAQVGGEFALRTEAQKAALQNGYNYDVRTTVDGFPIVVFYHKSADEELICLGQYNFNNDKSTEKVFGFKDIPGFDNSKVQCFEFLANENPICLFNDISNFDEGWSDAFESRYPDTKTPDLVPLKTLATWINSCKDNQEKWNTEKEDHFDLKKLAAYYVYLMRFGAVDQPVKNSMITTEDGVHWFFINYDNDTVLGIDNISTVLNAWDYDRNTQKVSGNYYYAGHESVLWNCFEADPACMALVSEVDMAIYSAGLTYKNMVEMFDDEQCDKWCERLYNDNGRYKYILPYQEKGSAVLYMLQGSRKSYRHWWLQHRMDLYDAKWASGAFRSRVIRFIAEGAPGGTFSVTSAADTYYGYGINSVAQEIGVQVAKGGSYDFTINQKLAIGDPVSIYNANNASKVDLSGFARYLTTLYINQAVGNDGASSLKSLILGDGETENVVFTEIGGLSSIKTIEEIDIRKYVSMTSIELGELKNLHVLRADDSGLTAFLPATGARLTEVTLPDTIQSIALEDAIVNGLEYVPTNALRSLSLRNVGGTWDAKAFVIAWITMLTEEELHSAELTLTGIDWDGLTAEQVIMMGSVGSKTLRGKVTIPSMTYDEYNSIVEMYGIDAFAEDSSFRIVAPSGLNLSGPTEIKETKSGTFFATTYPVSEIDVLYLLYSGDTLLPVQTDSDGRKYRRYNGVTLYEASGVCEVGTISADVSVRVRAQVNGTDVYSKYIDLTAKNLTTPSSVTINGESEILETGTFEYTKAFDTDDFTAEITSVEWSINENEYVNIASSDNDKATLQYSSMPLASTSVNLICKVIFENGTTLTNNKKIVLKLIPIDSFEIIGDDAIGEVGTSRYAIDNILPANYSTQIASLSGSISDSSIDITIETDGTDGVNVTLNALPSSVVNTTLTIEATLTDGTKVTEAKALKIGVISDIELKVRGNDTNKVSIVHSSKISKVASMNIDGIEVSTVASYAFNDKEIHTVIIRLNDITTIPGSLFSYCTTLESIIIPDCTKTIEGWAFNQCTSLSSIVLGKNLTTINNSAFINCKELTSVVIPANVTNIGNTIFSGFRPSYISVDSGNAVYDSRDNCNAIIEKATQKIIIATDNTILPSSVKIIGESAFRYTKITTSFDIPEGVVSIEKNAFYYCKFSSVTIPTTITNIASGAFESCSKLTRVDISDLAAWCNIEFKGSNSNPLYYAKHLYLNGVVITELAIPSGIAKINGYAFPNDVDITSVTIPDSVTKIGDNAFSGCSQLTSVTFGCGVTDIGIYVFFGCEKLKEFYCYPNSAPSISDYTFYSIFNATVYYPAEGFYGEWFFLNGPVCDYYEDIEGEEVETEICGYFTFEATL